MQSASKVGTLVLVFGGLMLGSYAILQRSIFAPKSDQYFAEFADAGGVTVGARVLLAGVNIGSVSKVELVGGNRAKLTLDVAQGTQIPQGTVAVLPTALIGIGDRQIELTPPVKTGGYLTSGATLIGSMKSPLDAFAPDSGTTVAAMEQTLKSATKTMDAMTKLLSDQSLKSDVQALMQQSAATAAAFGKLAARFDQTLSQNQAAIRDMMRNGSAISGDLAQMSRKFSSYVQSGKLQGGVDALMEQMNGALTEGRGLVADMRKAMNDPAVQDNIKGILANANTMSKTGTEITENAKILTGKGVDFADEATSLMKKANKLADEASDLFAELKKKIIGGGASGLTGALRKIELSADAHRESKPDRWRTDLGVKIPISSKENVHFGLWDAFESNKLNLQLGSPFGKNGELRYGVYASKPGAGINMPLGNSMALRGDVFGVNRTRFDARLEYKFTKNAVGWVGADRIFDRNTLSVGFGIRR